MGLIKKDRTKPHYELKDGEEDLGYEYKDGKRYRKIKRRIKVKKMLSNEEYAEIEKAFLLFDKDGSGTIDVSELRDALRVLGVTLNLNETKKLME
jgi:hypothetical protein